MDGEQTYEDLLVSTESGLSVLLAGGNLTSLDNRYGGGGYALCNSSRYANLVMCSGNKSLGVEEFKPDYTHGFAMERIISIVVNNYCIYRPLFFI